MNFEKKMNHNQSFSKQEVFDSPLATQSLEIKCKKVQDYKDELGYSLANLTAQQAVQKSKLPF